MKYWYRLELDGAASVHPVNSETEKEKQNMTDEQHHALQEIAEFMKDIINASDGDEPYTSDEIFELGMELLNNLSVTDYMLPSSGQR